MVDNLVAMVAAHQPVLGLAFVVALLVAVATEGFPPVFGAGVMVAPGWLSPSFVTAAFANAAPITIAAFALSVASRSSGSSGK